MKTLKEVIKEAAGIFAETGEWPKLTRYGDRIFRVISVSDGSVTMTRGLVTVCPLTFSTGKGYDEENWQIYTEPKEPKEAFFWFIKMDDGSYRFLSERPCTESFVSELGVNGYQKAIFNPKTGGFIFPERFQS